MSGEPTLRAHLEAQRALLGKELARETVANLVLLHKLHEHAVAALALLDGATRMPSAGIYLRPDNDPRCRLVPDPLPASIVAPRETHT